MTIGVNNSALKNRLRASKTSPVVFRPSLLRASVRRAIHGSKSSIDELAWSLKVNANTLYRYCLDGESGLRLPLELAAPLMHATKDYRLLDEVAADCDRIVVNPSRVRALKRMDQAALNSIQSHFLSAMGMLIGFWQDPKTTDRAAVLGAIQQHASDVEAIRRSVKDFDQGELF